MKRTFQSFVFGCRVNEAERMKLDKELVEAGFTVDLASPSFLIINTCAITGKAEREAKQLMYQLRRKHAEAKIVVTGCSATLWGKYKSKEASLADLVVPNDKKMSLVSLLQTSEVCKATGMTKQPQHDKFRQSNRLLVKIQDGCHRFCSYCIVPYLRGCPQSQKIEDIVTYINSFKPCPSEVVLSAINTESFGTDTKEDLQQLIMAVLGKTKVSRMAFGSIHPWSLNNSFLNYYENNLSQQQRFVQFFHVPIQSGSQSILNLMKREYQLVNVIDALTRIQKIQPNALIATDIVVGFLGETKDLFEETVSLLEKSPISRIHVFRFSNRPHTAAYFLRKKHFEPTEQEKKDRACRLIELSRKKFEAFIQKQVGRSGMALVIAKLQNGVRVLMDNQVEGFIADNNCLPGVLVRVTIIAAKEGIVICKES